MAQESQYEIRKRQLTAEVASIELKLEQKKKLIQSKRRSTLGYSEGIASDLKKSRRRKLAEADLDHSLGNDGKRRCSDCACVLVTKTRATNKSKHPQNYIGLSTPSIHDSFKMCWSEYVTLRIEVM